MKVLEQVRHKIKAELPHCKTHDDVEKLLNSAFDDLQLSKAPFGQRQDMWLDIKNHLSMLSRRPNLINDAHAIIDTLLKRLIT